MFIDAVIHSDIVLRSFFFWIGHVLGALTWSIRLSHTHKRVLQTDKTQQYDRETSYPEMLYTSNIYCTRTFFDSFQFDSIRIWSSQSTHSLIRTHNHVFDFRIFFFLFPLCNISNFNVLDFFLFLLHIFKRLTIYFNHNCCLRQIANFFMGFLCNFRLIHY